MLTSVLTLASVLFLAFELYFGIAVTGWTGDELYVERSKAPGPYWMFVAIHSVIAIGIPVLSLLAGL